MASVVSASNLLRMLNAWMGPSGFEPESKRPKRSSIGQANPRAQWLAHQRPHHKTSVENLPLVFTQLQQ